MLRSGIAACGPPQRGTGDGVKPRRYMDNPRESELAVYRFIEGGRGKLTEDWSWWYRALAHCRETDNFPSIEFSTDVGASQGSGRPSQRFAVVKLPCTHPTCYGLIRSRHATYATRFRFEVGGDREYCPAGSPCEINQQRDLEHSTLLWVRGEHYGQRKRLEAFSTYRASGNGM